MDYSGFKVLIMGLGLHGGGLESARFFLKRGAEVTVTDLRDEATLIPSIKQLNNAFKELYGNFNGINGKHLKYVLGKHKIEDFKNADIVVKNPGVRPDSPYLKAAKRIETDISLFLQESPSRLFAITGTKGKSLTSSALHWILNGGLGDVVRRAYLGGNITCSPLTFLDELTENDDVVLELSSFQLGDLKGRVKADGSPLLKPKAAILTAIMADHLDRYASMEEYIDDKRVIYRGQDETDVTVAGDDEWGRSFLAETKGKPVMYPLCKGGYYPPLLPDNLLIPGEHQRVNLLAAALAAHYAADVAADNIRSLLGTFRGIEHRIEFFHEANGIRFYNDSAATIPEAAAACIDALSAAPLVLVTGGTDKNLDFTPLATACSKAAAVILLAGTGSDKLVHLLAEKNIIFSGPFDKLEDAVGCALEHSSLLISHSSFVNLVLSPGCASFGMFLNEFDRGRKWKEEIKRATPN